MRLAKDELPAVAKALEDGLGKTSLAMAVADAWARSKQQSEWYFARSMEAIKEVKQRMKAESVVVLDEASATGSRHVDYVKALLSSDSANLDARNKDVVLPPKVRRILTCQELDRVEPCLKDLKSPPEQEQLDNLGEDQKAKAILRRMLVVHIEEAIYSSFIEQPEGDDEEDELTSTAAASRIFGHLES